MKDIHPSFVKRAGPFRLGSSHHAPQVVHISNPIDTTGITTMFILDLLRNVLLMVINLFLGNGGIISDRVEVAPYVVTEEMLTVVKRSLALSGQVFSGNLVEDSTTNAEITAFSDINDQALVKYQDGTCYAVFQGTDFSNLLDAFQSTPLFPRRVCGDAGCCTIETGVRQAYYSDYVEEFEAAVDQCYQRCDGGCRLVLSGFSQGGSIATVAAVVLAKYNPELITFGQQPMVWFGCDVLDNMDTYLRFVSVCDQGGDPAYDALSYYGNPLFARHSGTFILLGPGGQTTTVGHNTGAVLLPISPRCHDITNAYLAPMSRMTAGPIDGFDAGSMCTQDTECSSGQCSEKRCT